MNQQSANLYHHGIKGQHWGKRRGPPYPLDASRKYNNFLGQARTADIHIKKGTEAYRVQGSDAQKEGQVYVSFDKLDHMKYLTVASADIESGLAVDATLLNDGTEILGRQPYSVKLRLTEDVLAPSYEATMEAFVDTVDSMGRKALQKDYVDSGQGTNKSAKKYVEQFKDMSTDDLRDEAYVNFVATFTSDSKAKSIFLNSLKAKGYNAVIDEWDADLGNDGYTNAPMILFDSKSVKQTSSSKVTKDDVNYFVNLYNATNTRDVSDSVVQKWNSWAGTDVSKAMGSAVH